MGLLSFLSPKPRPDIPYVYPELRAQSYDTTAIALPPIRGSLPVQGNGPNTLGDLKRAARKRSEAQLSTRTAPLHNEHHVTPAPAPIVARLRSKSLGRPSTAPSVPNVPLPGTSRPKSAGRNTPSFVNTSQRKGPPYLIGVNGPEDEDIEAPPIPPIAARFMSSLPSSPITPSRPKAAAPSIASSNHSGLHKSAHVDLLDASSVINPSSFKTRLHASGARDYGEDVAERNMGVNGVDLTSPAVRGFYALTGGAPLAYRSDGSAVDVHGNRYAAGNIPTDLVSAARGQSKDEDGERDDEGAHVANMKLGQRKATFPTRTTSLQPKPAFATDAMSANERPSEIPSRRLSLHGAPVSNSAKQAKQRPLSMHPVFSTTSSTKTTSAIPPEVPRTRPTSSGRPKSSRSQSRDRKKKSSEARTKATTSKDKDPDEWARRARSSSSASRKGRKLHRHEDSDFSQFDFNIPSQDKVLPPIPRPSTSSGTQSQSRPQQQQRSTSQPRSHPQNRSTGAASLKSRGPQLHDIDEHLTPIPRDNESVSSIAPSTVASSNNQSRHTADTSLDLGFSMPIIPKGPSQKDHVRGKSSGAGSAARLTYASQRAAAPERVPFEEDDLTTTTDGSDMESYIDKRKRRKDDGEHLLFNEQRYGHSGGLPGLFDADPETPTLVKPVSKFSRPPTSAPRSHTKPPSLVSWQDNSSSSSLTVSESDIGGLGVGGYDPDEEEMDGKLDVKLAVRLRKEMKKRERLSVRTRGQKREDYEMGHVADTEG